MTRLPIDGQDAGVWGKLLNAYLLVAHDDAGNLRRDGDIDAALSTANSKYAKPASGIPESDLSASVQTKLNTTTGDATASSKGVIQLSGDLGGTAALPTVPSLATKTNKSTSIAFSLIFGG